MDFKGGTNIRFNPVMMDGDDGAHFIQDSADGRRFSLHLPAELADNFSDEIAADVRLSLQVDDGDGADADAGDSRIPRVAVATDSEILNIRLQVINRIRLVHAAVAGVAGDGSRVAPYVFNERGADGVLIQLGAVGGTPGYHYRTAAAGGFEVTPTTGAIRFASGSRPTESGSHTVTVTVTDNDGGADGIAETAVIYMSLHLPLATSINILIPGVTGDGTADDAYTFNGAGRETAILASVAVTDRSGTPPYTYQQQLNIAGLLTVDEEGNIRFDSSQPPPTTNGRHYLYMLVSDSSVPVKEALVNASFAVNYPLTLALDNRVIPLTVGEGAPGRTLATATAGGGAGDYRWRLQWLRGDFTPSNIGISEAGVIILNAPFSEAHVVEFLVIATDAQGNSVQTMLVIPVSPAASSAGAPALTVRSILSTAGDSTAAAGSDENPWLVPSEHLRQGVIWAAASASSGSGDGYVFGGGNADLTVNTNSGVITPLRDISPLDAARKYTLALTVTDNGGGRAEQTVVFLAPVVSASEPATTSQFRVRFSDAPDAGNPNRLPLLRGEGGQPVGTAANPYRYFIGNAPAGDAPADIGVVSAVDIATGRVGVGHTFAVTPVGEGLLVDETSGIVFDNNLSVGENYAFLLSASAAPSADAAVEPLAFHLRAVDSLRFSVRVRHVADGRGLGVIDGVAAGGVTVVRYGIPRQNAAGDSNLTVGAVVAVVDGIGGDGAVTITGADDDGNPVTVFHSSYSYRGNSDYLAVDGVSGEIRLMQDISGDLAAAYRVTVTIDDNSGVPAHSEVVIITVPAARPATPLMLETACPSAPISAGRTAETPCLTARTRANQGGGLLSVGIAPVGDGAPPRIAVHSVSRDGAYAAGDIVVDGASLRLAGAMSGAGDRSYEVVLALTDGAAAPTLVSVHLRLLGALTVGIAAADGIIGDGTDSGNRFPYRIRTDQLTGALFTVMVTGAVGTPTVVLSHNNFAVDGAGVVRFTGAPPLADTIYTIPLVVNVDGSSFETKVVIEVLAAGLSFIPNPLLEQLSDHADGSRNHPYTFSSDDANGALLGAFSAYGGARIGAPCTSAGDGCGSRADSRHFVLSGMAEKRLAVRTDRAESRFLPHNDDAWEFVIRDAGGRGFPFYFQFEYTPIRLDKISFFHDGRASAAAKADYIAARATDEDGAETLHIRIPRADLLNFSSSPQGDGRRVFQLAFKGGTNIGLDPVIKRGGDGFRFIRRAANRNIFTLPLRAALANNFSDAVVADYRFSLRVDDADGVDGTSDGIRRRSDGTESGALNVRLEIINRIRVRHVVAAGVGGDGSRESPHTVVGNLVGGILMRLSGHGGAPGYRYRVAADSEFEANWTTGEIRFKRDRIPTELALYSVTVTVLDGDGAGNAAPAVFYLSVNVAASEPLSISVHNLVPDAGGNGRETNPYTFAGAGNETAVIGRVVIVGGAPPYTYQKRGVDGGLTVDEEGNIRFDPSQPPPTTGGLHGITVDVIDRSGPAQQRTVNAFFLVHFPLALSLDNPSVLLLFGDGLPGRTLATVTARGGAGHHAYRLRTEDGGSPPANMGIGADGVITLSAPFFGTDAQAIRLSVFATDRAGNSVRAPFAILLMNPPSPAPFPSPTLLVQSALSTAGDHRGAAGTDENPWLIPASHLREGVILAAVTVAFGGGGYVVGGGNDDLAVNTGGGVITLVRDISPQDADRKYTLAVTATAAGAGMQQTVVFLVSAAFRREFLPEVLGHLVGGIGGEYDPYVIYRRDIAAGVALARVAASLPADESVHYSRRAADSSDELALDAGGRIHFTVPTPAVGGYSIAVDIQRADSVREHITVYMDVQNAPSIRSFVIGGAFSGGVVGSGTAFNPYRINAAAIVPDEAFATVRARTAAGAVMPSYSTVSGSDGLFATADGHIGIRRSLPAGDYLIVVGADGANPPRQITIFVRVTESQLRVRFSDAPDAGNPVRNPLLRGDGDNTGRPPGTAANPYRYLLNRTSADIGVMSVVDSATGRVRGAHRFAVAPLGVGLVADAGSGIVSVDGMASGETHAFTLSALVADAHGAAVEPAAFHLRAVNALDFSVMDGAGATVGVVEVARRNNIGAGNLTVGAVVARVTGAGGDGGRIITDADGNFLFAAAFYAYRGASDHLAVDGDSGAIHWTRDVSGETAAAAYRITVTVDDDSGVPAYTEVVVISVAAVQPASPLILETHCPSAAGAGRAAAHPCLTARAVANRGGDLLSIGVSDDHFNTTLSIAVQRVTGSDGTDAAGDIIVDGAALRLAATARNGDGEESYTVVLALTDGSDAVPTNVSVHLRLLASLRISHTAAAGIIGDGGEAAGEFPYRFRTSQLTGGLLTVTVIGAGGALQYNLTHEYFAIDDNGVITFIATPPPENTRYTISLTVAVAGGESALTTDIIVLVQSQGLSFTPNPALEQRTDNADGSRDNPYTFSVNDAAGVSLGVFSAVGGAPLGDLCETVACGGRAAGRYFALSGNRGDTERNLFINESGEFLPPNDDTWEVVMTDAAGQSYPVYFQFEYAPIALDTVSFFHDGRAVAAARADYIESLTPDSLHIRIPRAELFNFSLAPPYGERQIFQLAFKGGTNIGLNAEVVGDVAGRRFSRRLLQRRIFALLPRAEIERNFSDPVIADIRFTLRVDDRSGADADGGAGNRIPRRAAATAPGLFSIRLEIINNLPITHSAAASTGGDGSPAAPYVFSSGNTSGVLIQLGGGAAARQYRVAADGEFEVNATTGALRFASGRLPTESGLHTVTVTVSYDSGGANEILDRAVFHLSIAAFAEIAAIPPIFIPLDEFRVRGFPLVLAEPALADEDERIGFVQVVSCSMDAAQDPAGIICPNAGTGAFSEFGISSAFFMVSPVSRPPVMALWNSGDSVVPFIATLALRVRQWDSANPPVVRGQWYSHFGYALDLQPPSPEDAGTGTDGLLTITVEAIAADYTPVHAVTLTGTTVPGAVSDKVLGVLRVNGVSDHYAVRLSSPAGFSLVATAPPPAVGAAYELRYTGRLFAAGAAPTLLAGVSVSLIVARGDAEQSELVFPVPLVQSGCYRAFSGGEAVAELSSAGTVYLHRNGHYIRITGSDSQGFPTFAGGRANLGDILSVVGDEPLPGTLYRLYDADRYDELNVRVIALDGASECSSDPDPYDIFYLNNDWEVTYSPEQSRIVHPPPASGLSLSVAISASGDGTESDPWLVRADAVGAFAAVAASGGVPAVTGAPYRYAGSDALITVDTNTGDIRFASRASESTLASVVLQARDDEGTSVQRSFYLSVVFSPLSLSVAISASGVGTAADPWRVRADAVGAFAAVTASGGVPAVTGAPYRYIGRGIPITVDNSTGDLYFRRAVSAPTLALIALQVRDDTGAFVQRFFYLSVIVATAGEAEAAPADDNAINGAMLATAGDGHGYFVKNNRRKKNLSRSWRTPAIPPARAIYRTVRDRRRMVGQKHLHLPS